MKNKDILFLDLDGCIADFDKAIKDAHPYIDIDMTNEKWRDLVDHYCENKNQRIFRDLKLIEGAESAVHILDREFNIYFLSTPMYNVPYSYMDKRLWLEEHFGKVAHKKLILSHNKGLCVGKYLIDDRIKNGVENFKGEHIHFGTEKFPDWDAVLTYVL